MGLLHPLILLGLKEETNPKEIKIVQELCGWSLGEKIFALSSATTIAIDAEGRMFRSGKNIDLTLHQYKNNTDTYRNNLRKRLTRRK